MTSGRRTRRAICFLAAGFFVAAAAARPAAAGLAVYVSLLGMNEGPYTGDLTTFTDSDTSRMPSDYTASIHWSDDGTTSAGTVTGSGGTFRVGGSHTFTEEGYVAAEVTVTVNATMETGGGEVMVKVSEADVLFGTPVQFAATTGVSFTTVVATFTDSYAGNQPGGFDAYVDWGDGTSTYDAPVTGGGGSFSVSGTHTYTQVGTFDVQVTLADLPSGSAQASVTSFVDVTGPAARGLVHFSSASYAAAESAGSAAVTVVRSGGSSGVVGVSYATGDGTGVAGRDYTPVSGTLTWADGDATPKTFSVPLLADPFVAAAETVNLTLAGPTGGAVLASPSTAVLSITHGSCTPSDIALCLGTGRFKVQATWQAAGAGGAAGSGHAMPLTDDTGTFWFFASANVELIVKVLDGCALNGHHWVFAGGLTNVAVALTVTDTQTGEARTYTSQQGTAYLPVQDVNAFATCP